MTRQTITSHFAGNRIIRYPNGICNLEYWLEGKQAWTAVEGARYPMTREQAWEWAVELDPEYRPVAMKMLTGE